MKETRELIGPIITEGSVKMESSSVEKEFKPRNRTCEDHGVYQVNRMHDGCERFLPDCPVCMKQRELKALMGRALIPERFLLKTLDTYEILSENHRRAHKIAHDYAMTFSEKNKSGTSMIFVGDPGTGKTHLSCGIANFVLSQGFSALFITVAEMIRTIRRSYQDKTVYEGDLINKFVKPDLLILDEVGMHRGTEEEKRTIFEVMNGRYFAQKPCIVISNLDVEGIREYLSLKTFDRLREAGGRCVVFDWESYRDVA